ncbi:MAG: TonB-dependent receptor [Synergistaceae bacterium]|nr:TonB-dependent receptor [Synergistaceae bacterium]
MSFVLCEGASLAPLSKKRLAALCALTVMFPTLASAALNLPEEVVSSSAIYDENEDKYLSPGMVTVVRPQARTGEQKNLPELLEEVPGLRVIRLQGRNGYSVASVRGSTSSQVAVYVDGVLMNLQSEAAVDLSAIPVDNVERIEVYRGYVPAQFGAQAMGGVINIVTKSPERPSTEASLGVGSFGLFKGSVSHTARTGGGKFFSSFGYETYDGGFSYWNDNNTPYNNTDDYEARRRGNGFENTDVLLKWGNADWRTRASWVRKNRDIPLIGPGLDKPGIEARLWPLLDTDRWDLSAGRSHKSGSVNWAWELSHTGQSKRYDSRRGGALSSIGGSSVTKSEYAASKYGISLNANTALGERHFLELLTEYSDETLDVDGDIIHEYMNGIDKYSRRGWNINVQDTIALDGAGSFLATPSIRWHKLDDEDRFTWQLAVTKEFSPSLMLKGAYGTYARSPNMYEEFGDGAFILPSARGLDWETGKQLDIGVIWNGTPNISGSQVLGASNVSLSLSGFLRETDNLIEFVVVNPRYGRYENVAKSEVKGVELEGKLDWKRWTFSLSSTWMDAVNRTPDDPGAVRYNGMTLPNRPEWSGTARLTRKFDWGSAFAEYQHIGENFADMSEHVLFDARNILNVGLKCDVSPTMRLVIGVNDVLDDADSWRMRPNGLGGPTRILWYPVEGRSYYLTLDVKL